MLRSICYWINLAVNLAFHPQAFPFINPCGEAPQTQEFWGRQANCETAKPRNCFYQSFSWSGSASETRWNACCALTDRPCACCHRDPPQGGQPGSQILNSIYSPLETNTVGKPSPLENTESNSVVPGLTRTMEGGKHSKSFFFFSWHSNLRSTVSYTLFYSPSHQPMM